MAKLRMGADEGTQQYHDILRLDGLDTKRPKPQQKGVTVPDLRVTDGLACGIPYLKYSSSQAIKFPPGCPFRRPSETPCSTP